MPEPVLDIVSEDVKVQHVAQQVQPTAMQKHARDERGDVEVGTDGEAPGREPIDTNEMLDSRPQALFMEENGDVGRDEGVRHERKRGRSNRIAEGNHCAMVTWRTRSTKLAP